MISSLTPCNGHDPCGNGKHVVHHFCQSRRQYSYQCYKKKKDADIEIKLKGAGCWYYFDNFSKRVLASCSVSSRI